MRFTLWLNFFSMFAEYILGVFWNVRLFLNGLQWRGESIWISNILFLSHYYALYIHWYWQIEWNFSIQQKGWQSVKALCNARIRDLDVIPGSGRNLKNQNSELKSQKDQSLNAKIPKSNIPNGSISWKVKILNAKITIAKFSKVKIPKIKIERTKIPKG